MWIFWIGISLCAVSLHYVEGNNDPQDYIYCYDCHYDPDTEKEAHSQSGPYPGFPKCSMDQSVNEGNIDKWPCSAGKCFIRRDPNGLVYRGCADRVNLPWGVDGNKNCEYQGQKPSLWWFCEGDRCNGGNFGSGDICPDSPALPYESSDDAYVETVHGPAYAEENYPDESVGYADKFYKEEPVYVEPPKMDYNPPEVIKEPVYPQPPKKSDYESKGKEGGQKVDVYGVYTAEVAPVFPKKNAYPIPYDAWAPYDSSYQKYDIPENHDISINNGKSKKSHYEEPKKSGYDGKSHDGYQTKQVPPLHYKSEPPKQPSYKPQPPKKSPPPKQPMYKPEPPKEPPQKPQPPKKSQSPPKSQHSYKSEPPKQSHYKSVPPKQPHYKSLPPKQPHYKSAPPKQPSYKSEPPKQPSYKSQPPQKSSYKSQLPKQMSYKSHKKSSYQPPYKSSPPKSSSGQYKSTGYDYGKSKQPAPQTPQSKFPFESLSQSQDFVHGLYNQEQQGFESESFGTGGYEDSKTGYDSQVNNGYDTQEDSYSQQQPYGAETGAKSGFDEVYSLYEGTDGYGYDKNKYGDNSGYDSDGVSNPCDGRCDNNPSGLFPHSRDADWFIQCGNGMEGGKTCSCCKPYYLQCPKGTTFDVTSRVCGETTGSYGLYGGEPKYKSVEY